MFFGDRNSKGPEKGFTSTDLYQYVEKLLKLTSKHDKSYERTNYSWLKARELDQIHDPTVERHLEELQPLIYKMTSENSAAIAVKLDKLTEEQHFNVPGLLTLIKRLLLEQDSASILEKNVGRVKEGKSKRIFKVRPELVGREATVSFIVENDCCAIDNDNSDNNTPYYIF